MKDSIGGASIAALRLGGVLAAALVPLTGCRDSGRPEPPAILRDVAMVRDAGDGTAVFLRPHVPPVRTTHDGRVGLMVESGPIRLYVLAPEKLAGPIVSSDPSASILASTVPFDGGISLRPGGRGFSHQAICDVAPRYLEPGQRTNPYSCGESGANDCYDVTHIGFTGQRAPGEVGDLWGTPMTVEVAEPKTAGAHIVDVALGEPVSTPLPGAVWFEPMVTADGRLLTGRRANTTDPIFYTWTNPETGEKRTRIYDLMYAHTREEFAPCDVLGWTRFHPVTHMPYDPDLIGRYGVAAFPFRDAEGKLIPDGEEMGVTYPWLDRDGDTLFMTAIDSALRTAPEDLYPWRCVVEGCEESFPESVVNRTRGHTMVGLWTRGKLVHLDSMVNNVDWAIPLPPHGHRMVTLYEDDTGPVEVRVGGGRSNSWSGPLAAPASFMGNTNILESVENLFNMHGHLKPVTPFDIVWVISNDRATDELVFDDYLDPDAFIVSSMQGSVSYEGRNLMGVVYHDGSNGLLGGSYRDDVHLQNAATATPDRWVVPAYGRVEVGTGRLEPVALGGVKGKGFWLDGTNRVTYDVAAQPTDLASHDWWVSIFLDARARDAAERNVIAFSDGTSLRVHGRDQLIYARGDETLRAISLGELWPDEGWVHVGLNLLDQGRRVVLHVNGYAFDDYQAPSPLFRMTPGVLQLGDDPEDDVAGFRGWIDDLKVFAHGMDPEVACNHAHGTLIGVETDARWLAVAERYPDWAHAALGGLVSDDYPGFACYADYTADWAAHLGNIPAGADGLRGRLIFPEGPLRYGVSRPDSRANSFCTTCHSTGAPHGLSLAALEPRAVNAEHDPRRQPSQPAPLVHGNVPAGWIAPGAGPGGPAEALVAPESGIDVDRWVLP